MNNNDKRQLINNILDIISELGDTSHEDVVQSAFDHEIDKAMDAIFSAVGEEANVNEVFQTGVLKDWVDENMYSLFPLNAPKPYHHCHEFDDWAKRYACDFRIDAIFDRRDIERFVREE